MSGAWAKGSVSIGGQPAGTNAAEILLASKSKPVPTAGSSAVTAGGGGVAKQKPAATAALAGDGKQLFDYYLIMDFEATCEDGQKLPDQEVIEFPAVLVDSKTLTVVSEFQRYVRPVRRPNLSAFCTNLTGIQQSQVNGAKTFPDVYKEFVDWLKSGNLGAHAPCKSFAVVTCGDWDFKTMFPLQLSLVQDSLKKSGEPTLSENGGLPLYFSRWINLKNVLAKHASVLSNGKSTRAPRGMDDMLRWFNLPLIGRHHSGIDDCRNIASCTMAAMKILGPLDFTWAGKQGQVGDHFFGKDHPVPPRSVIDVDPKAKWDGNMSSKPSTATTGTAATAGGGGGRVAGAKAPRHVAEGSGFGPYLVLDDTRAQVAQDLLQAAGGDGAKNLTPQEKTGMSKKISWMLRHGALSEGLGMSSNGFVAVDALLSHKNLGKRVSKDFLAEIVANCSKQRFMLGYGAQDGVLYIRANQGHSIEGVSVDMKKIEDPSEVPVAVHGTHLGAWKTIKDSGLSKMGRQHVHFAKGLPGDQQVISGMRNSAQVLIYMNVPLLLSDGIPLLMSENGVLLSPGVGEGGMILPKYFLSVVDAKTGAKLM